MKLLGSCSPPGGCHGTGRTPSKRSRPNSVPSQRYPSGVWAIKWSSPLLKPSRTFHDLCAYWLMSSEGSSAEAQTHHARRIEDSVPASTTTCRTHPPHVPVHVILSHSLLPGFG